MTAAFHCLLTESVSLRPAPPRCACVRCARNGRPADVSALPCQDVLRAHHALLPARARIPSSASVCCAVRALRAARAHRRMYPPTPPSYSAISGELSAGGTRQCPPNPAAVCGARKTFFAHVTAIPRHAPSGFAAGASRHPQNSGAACRLSHTASHPRVWSGGSGPILSKSKMTFMYSLLMSSSASFAGNCKHVFSCD